jgi:competence protein ComEA
MNGRWVWGAWIVFAVAAAWGVRDFRPHRPRVPKPVLSHRPSFPASFQAAPLAYLSRAPVDSLTLLPGIGPVLARRVADVRSGQGPFTSWSDLRTRVRGIGEKSVARLQRLSEPVEDPVGTWVQTGGRKLQGPGKNARGAATSP